MSGLSPYELRAKYTRFRILVIGRANAGKTTLLQRVCKTDEDPCIYDKNNKNLLEPTSARGIHDIHRPFAFRSNPRFIFHDSPGFETGDKKQLEEVLSFLEEKAKSTDANDQLHAIWFCIVLNNARPLFPLETEFFETARAGKVPVIAIFTKFDDLISQIYDIDEDDDINRRNAEEQVEKKFRKPLYGYPFPPRADVCFEGLDTPETGKHQDQVKVLIERTASSLDDTALKMLFVSVQQNNIGLCVQYAIDDLIEEIGDLNTHDMIWRTMLWFGHSYFRNYNYGVSEAVPNAVSVLWTVAAVATWLAIRTWLKVARRTEAQDLAIFLNAYYKSENLQEGFPVSSLIFFTALLICMENTFWNIRGDGNFVKSFKESFTLYVDSGIRKKAEAEANMLRNEHGESEHLATQDFKAKFCKVITDNDLPHPESGDQAKLTWLKKLKLKIGRGQRK